MSEYLISPATLMFLLGILAGSLKSTARLSSDVLTVISFYLLLSIGLKGGIEIYSTPLSAMILPTLGALLIGGIVPLITFFIALRILKHSKIDSGALAAHYGSISIVTFTVAISYLKSNGVPFEGFVVALAVLMEVPGILVALLLANRGRGNFRASIHEVVTGKGVYVLCAGILLGTILGNEKTLPIQPFLFSLFPGVLVLFLYGLGFEVADRFKDVSRGFLGTAIFAAISPFCFGAMGVVIGELTGLSVGGSMLLGALSASASYIAATAACRVALPDANPAIFLSASLGVTFPINLTIGIPFLYELALHVHS